MTAAGYAQHVEMHTRCTEADVPLYMCKQAEPVRSTERLKCWSWSRLPRAVTRWVLSIPRDGDSKTALSNLCQFKITFVVFGGFFVGVFSALSHSYHSIHTQQSIVFTTTGRRRRLLEQPLLCMFFLSDTPFFILKNTCETFKPSEYQKKILPVSMQCLSKPTSGGIGQDPG